MLHQYTLSPREDTPERHAHEARYLEGFSPYPATKPVVLGKEGKSTVYGIDVEPSNP